MEAGRLSRLQREEIKTENADSIKSAIERLGSLRLQPDARPPERRRLGFDTAVEDIDGVA